jgi:hypothetical protein
VSEIIIGKPPNFDEILAKFPGATGKVLIAYDGKIYNPTGDFVPPALQAHEEVHLIRQLGRVEAWWKQYIEDEEFRWFEEVMAHRAEFRVQAQFINDRNARERLLMSTAARLVAPLYGYSAKKLAMARKALTA